MFLRLEIGIQHNSTDIVVVGSARNLHYVHAVILKIAVSCSLTGVIPCTGTLFNNRIDTAVIIHFSLENGVAYRPTWRVDFLIRVPVNPSSSNQRRPFSLNILDIVKRIMTDKYFLPD